MSAPLTYWHSGGDIMVHRLPNPQAITREQALDLMEQHHNAITDGDRSQRVMFSQLNAALLEQERWNQCAA